MTVPVPLSMFDVDPNSTSNILSATESNGNKMSMLRDEINGKSA